jgi:hypothetical protein
MGYVIPAFYKTSRVSILSLLLGKWPMVINTAIPMSGGDISSSS